MEHKVVYLSNKVFLVPLAWFVGCIPFLYCDDIKLVATGLAMMFCGTLSVLLVIVRIPRSVLVIGENSIGMSVPKKTCILYKDIRFVYVKKWLWFKWIVVEKKDKTLIYLKGWADPDQIVADIKHYAFTTKRSIQE